MMIAERHFAHIFATTTKRTTKRSIFPTRFPAPLRLCVMLTLISVRSETVEGDSVVIATVLATVSATEAIVNLETSLGMVATVDDTKTVVVL